MSKEIFLDNLFENDAREQNKENKGKVVTGCIWLDRYGFKTKKITGVIQNIYYSKSADVNIYVIKSIKSNKLYNVYEFNLIY